jgi:hypothetical protein
MCTRTKFVAIDCQRHLEKIYVILRHISGAIAKDKRVVFELCELPEVIQHPGAPDE